MAKNTTYVPNNDYNVNILETSREFTKRERIMLKDVSNAIKLDDAVASDGTPLVVTPVAFAVLQIHNGKSKSNPDYNNYIILDKDNNKYVTGSPSFWSAFTSIWSEMQDEEIGWSIEIYKRPSKNFNGKDFITCSII